ncbi:MAG: hypothetical protein ACRCV9_16295 [Burkholderiaceae bacterium]
MTDVASIKLCHTPGPWFHKPFGPRSAAQIVTCSLGDARGDIANVLCSLGAKTEQQAIGNARLIAAAPDLLKACVLVEELSKNFDARTILDDEGKVRAVLRAAIAKATGKTY